MYATVEGGRLYLFKQGISKGSNWFTINESNKQSNYSQHERQRARELMVDQQLVSRLMSRSVKLWNASVSARRVSNATERILTVKPIRPQRRGYRTVMLSFWVQLVIENYHLTVCSWSALYFTSVIHNRFNMGVTFSSLDELLAKEVELTNSCHTNLKNIF